MEIPQSVESGGVKCRFMPVPYYRSDLNEIPKRFAEPEYPLAVTPGSPLKLKTEVERFAIYWRREFNYDHQQFEATEDANTNR